MRADPALPGPRSHRGEIVAIAIAFALTAFAYGWTLRTVNFSFTTHGAMDHYAYLTDALLSGQLHLKLEPDPHLADLDNPYAGSQGIPRLHDATYYDGHYFLYFGPTPVVLLLGPWHLLTRTFLTQGTATIVFAFAGFAIGASLWIDWKRRYLPALAPGWVGLAILMLGLGNYVFFLIQTPMVYELPISCAYACLMAALALVVAAVRAESVSAQGRRLGLASAALGLAVGARPDYLFLLPALGVPLGALWWRARQREGPEGTGGRRLIAWSVAPAAAIGALLAAYNWARFGDIMEFGLEIPARLLRPARREAERRGQPARRHP